jgi:hypothetical protein
MSQPMVQLSLHQAISLRNPAVGRKHLLDKILSTFDGILEFDPKTGGLKLWAWQAKF